MPGDFFKDTERELWVRLNEFCVIGQGVQCGVGVVSDVGCGGTFQQHVCHCLMRGSTGTCGGVAFVYVV